MIYSALFAVYLLLSIWSVIPSQRERSMREEDIELQKFSKYEPDPVSREEQREYNRQLFLNLPKTPTTPFGKNPMTPRTTAFTQLSGEQQHEYYGSQPPMPSTSGPDRQFPLRQYEPQTVPNAR